MATSPDLGLHVVKIGLGGTFRPSGQVRTTPADIDAIFAHLKQTGGDRLTLYFHGGLNSTRQGIAVAKVMEANYAGVSHPVTFVWETGFRETVRQNLRTASAGDLFQAALSHVIAATSRRLGRKRGDRGDGPSLSAAQIRTQLDHDEPFARSAPEAVDAIDDTAVPEPDDGLLGELEAELAPEVADDPRLEGIRTGSDPDVRLLDPAAARRKAKGGGTDRGLLESAYLVSALALTSWRVIRRHWTKRNHGFYPTIVEEVLREFFVADGIKWVWDGMKTKASQMWRPNAGTTGLEQHVGTYFLDRLAELRAHRPGLVVDVVGHSAGSIAACHLLAAMGQRPAVNIRRVVFLAPACTVGQFHQEVVSQPTRFQEFRTFALRDAQERADRLVPYVYPWSLLYFVSGVLEKSAGEPLLGLERSLLGRSADDSPEMRDVLDYLRAAGGGRVVWAGDPGSDGARSEARTHGAFDDDPVTLASLRWLAAN